MEDYSNERLDAAEELLDEQDEDAMWIWNKASNMVKLWLASRFKRVVEQ